MWDEPHRDSGLLALTAAIAVRDFQPTSFLDVHQALFDARHSGRNLRDESVLAAVLNEAGADGDTAMDEVDSGRPLERVRAEHTKAATEHCVWGVPTFIVGNEAAFVRLMERPCGNGEMARSTIERTVDLLGGWPGLNEFKHTSVAR